MNCQYIARLIVAAVLSSCALSATGEAPTRVCTDLAGTKLGAGLVESAEWVAQGQKVAIDPMVTSSVGVAFCRVSARLKPALGSDIRAEFWLPEPAQWNHKFLGSGNGGFGGSLNGTALVEPLKQGYAGGMNDTGHSGSVLDAGWAFRQPDKLLDWAQRANHVTAEAANN